MNEDKKTSYCSGCFHELGYRAEKATLVYSRTKEGHFVNTVAKCPSYGLEWRLSSVERHRPPC
jgi:hypothetical protein